MLPYVIAGLVGAAIVGRNKPKSNIRKSRVLGLSGNSYEAEEVEGLGVFVVYMHDGSRGVFSKTQSGLAFSHGVGNPEAIEVMRSDLEATRIKEERKEPHVASE